jgi:dihydroorotate dehydrogenase
MSAEDALEKIECGADLVQLYTGFIYEGPSLIKRINRLLLNQELKRIK